MKKFYERLIVSARIKAICVSMMITTTLYAQGVPPVAGKAEGGELIDGRDGNVYKTVTIGNHVWMAENLRFDDGKYTRTAAREACPGGWHFPSQREFDDAIEKAIGDKKIELQNLAKNTKKKNKGIKVRCVRDFLLVSEYGRRIGE